MKTATITFQAGSYITTERLINSFRALIVTTTDMSFFRAEIIQNSLEINHPNASTITLHSKTGFIIKVVGLHPGHDGAKIIGLLNFCGFKMDDATKYSIINREIININIWNEKNME